MSRTANSSELPTLRIQSIVYNTEPAALARMLRHLIRAIQKARALEILGLVDVSWGDGSKEPVLDAAAVRALEIEAEGVLTLKYTFFGENKGTARGHNFLFEGCKSDFFLVMNPDVLVAPDCLIELFRPFNLDGTGMVEARQLPIEHPKDYSPETGWTSWASTACCLIDGGLMRKLGGFDSDSFFLYCDDVDFSWRVRLTGCRVIFQPSAVVFHDKRLKQNGRWAPSKAEIYYSAEAALFLPHKWSRPDIVKQRLHDFKWSADEALMAAAKAFESRRNSGRLCSPLDPDHSVGEFKGDDYAVHRFTL